VRPSGRHFWLWNNESAHLLPETADTKLPKQAAHSTKNLFCFDVGGLLSLLPLRHFKRHFLSFLERFEAVHADRGKMGEQIIAPIIWRDKTEPFCVVKPFNCTGCHDDYSLLKTGTPLQALLVEAGVSIAFGFANFHAALQLAAHVLTANERGDSHDRTIKNMNW
jgi:hypothetical protein